jgi:putative NIF3 family GTP cyclohydrolase 1 type 2
MTFKHFAEFVDSRLETKCLGWGDPSRTIHKVAVVGGSGDDLWNSALKSRADVLVTGEVKQHIALEAQTQGIAMIAAGHYATENPGMKRLANQLSERFGSIEWLMYEPEKGRGGRPL